MPDALIFGAGGHASVIASMLPGRNIVFVARETRSVQRDIRVVAESEIFDRIDDYRSHEIYIGIGDNLVRQAIYDKLSAAGIAPTSCVAANAFVASNAQLGPGVVICPGGVVMANARLEANVIVNTLSSVDHDCFVGAHSQITAGVTLGGGARMGRNCFVGLKSAILPAVSLGNGVTVMAGSVVTADIPDSVLVGGNPARILRAI